MFRRVCWFLKKELTTLWDQIQVSKSVNQASYLTKIEGHIDVPAHFNSKIFW